MDTLKQSTAVEEALPVATSFKPDPKLQIPAPRKRGWLKWILAGVVLLVAGGAWKSMRKPDALAYSAVRVQRGDLAMTIGATGKVQAVKTVEVGTQVSGTVSELHADFNDHVRAGQVIARLDPSQFEAQLQQAKASLASAEARVAAARSTSDSQSAAVQASKAAIDNANAALVEADRAYKVYEELAQYGAAPRRQVETSDAARIQAQAQKTQAEAQYRQMLAQSKTTGAQLDQATAEATQAKAAVEVAAVNLERTYIRSPIDGVVVARNVNVGQTVAASLQAPVLFLIANDLSKMQVLADIDEADVGQLNSNSKVAFTVDAFPQETFAGKISQVRLAPTVVQNVTTYTAVIDVENPRMELKPGMTAIVTATVAEKHDVLLVPNAALRFRPESAAAPAGARGGGTVLWKVDGAELKPVRVPLGMTDGVSTEIAGGEVAEGDRIAVPQQQPASPQKKQASPFSGGGRRGGRF